RTRPGKPQDHQTPRSLPFIRILGAIGATLTHARNPKGDGSEQVDQSAPNRQFGSRNESRLNSARMQILGLALRASSALAGIAQNGGGHDPTGMCLIQMITKLDFRKISLMAALSPRSGYRANTRAPKNALKTYSSLPFNSQGYNFLVGDSLYIRTIKEGRS
ncbi:5083_t:CDS:2, partial [Acaulospora colombiana]